MATRSPIETHAYWGIVPSAASLPNVPGSPIQDANLEEGDQAYVSGVGYFVCTNPALGVAVWAQLSTGSPGGGSANWQLGPLLWEWNQVDVSQFEPTAFPFQRDLGTPSPNAATALTLSVINRGRLIGNVLQIDAVSLAGGGVFGVLASEVTLPERYMMVARYLAPIGGNPSLFPVIFTSYTPTLGAFQGFGYQRDGTSNTVSARAAVNDRAGGAEALASGGVPGTTDRRGNVGVLEVYRVNGDTPATAFLGQEERSPTNAPIDYDAALPAAISGVSTNWDGIDMPRFGFGCWEGINNTSGTVNLQIMSLQVYEHPED